MKKRETKQMKYFFTARPLYDTRLKQSNFISFQTLSKANLIQLYIYRYFTNYDFYFSSRRNKSLVC